MCDDGEWENIILPLIINYLRQHYNLRFNDEKDGLYKFIKLIN